MNKKIIFSLGMTLAVLTLINFVSAFAVSSMYWENYPLVLSPGQTITVPIFLQNIAGTEDITVEASITQGEDIAHFLDNETTYFIPLGQKTQVNISFSAPKDVTTDETYAVIFSFKVLASSEAQPLGIGTSIEKVIPVSIKTPMIENKEGITKSIYFLLALVILFVFFSAYRLFSKEHR
jgi:hypothetical protein